MAVDIPVVLVFGGHDPSGGAGIQADIQTLSALGCHPVAVITAITAQDTSEIKGYTTVKPSDILAQAKAVLDDMSVAVCKTGMLVNGETVDAVAQAVAHLKDVPLIVDPVLASNTGQKLATSHLERSLQEVLLPQAAMVTPNLPEVRRLAPQAATPDACAQTILGWGCRHVLLTGTHDDTDGVVHRFYDRNGVCKTSTWRRLPGEYHGSGCTLAAAIAAYVAHGVSMGDAVDAALAYTWNSLKNGFRPGSGQSLPDRLYAQRPQLPPKFGTESNTCTTRGSGTRS